MWKLSVDPSLENEYLAKFQDGLIKRILNGMGNTTLSKKVRKVLISDYNARNPKRLDNVKKLLTGKPLEAFELNNKLMKKIFSDYDTTNLETLIPHKDVLKKIENVFNYEGVISRNKDNSYWLAQKVGKNTCTYCNRLYTITVISTDSNDYITRPQFDHWFPKEKFPLLSLNMYNLIPSCPICNSSVKGREVFSLTTHIHPYIQTKNDPDFKFIPKESDKNDREWTVCLERTNDSKEDKTIQAFRLDDIYDVHGDLEVKDLINFARAYTDNYLHDLFQTVLSDFSNVGYTKSDVFRMIFGAEYLPEHTLNRPLSKLKRDILAYLKVI